MTADSILKDLKDWVESDKDVPRERWLDGAFKLAVLRIEESKKFNLMKQKVAEIKLGILKGQDRKNVALAEVEVESKDIYREMRDQEDKIYSIDELVRVAKKNSDINL